METEIRLESRAMKILFGSQTGTAEEVAQSFGRQTKRYRFVTCVHSLDQFQISDLPLERVILFVVATTGQGDPPTNMKKFWKFIWQRALANDCLNKLKFAVIGLGDSSYQKFNFIGKKLYKRLEMLGAESIMPCCLGDDQHDYGYHGAISNWSIDFWNKLMKLYPLPCGMDTIPKDILLPSSVSTNFLSREINNQEQINKNNFSKTSYNKILENVKNNIHLTEYINSNDPTKQNNELTNLTTLFNDKLIDKDDYTINNLNNTDNKKIIILQDQNKKLNKDCSLIVGNNNNINKKYSQNNNELFSNNSNTTDSTNNDPYLLPYDKNFPYEDKISRKNKIKDNAFHENNCSRENNLNNRNKLKLVNPDSPFNASIIENKQVTHSQHWQDVRLITFDISGSNIQYSPGDVVYIKPKNSLQSIQEFLNIMRLDSETLFTWTTNDVDARVTKLPNPCKVGWLLDNYWDITAVPKSYFWEVMANIAKDDLEREKLNEFITQEGMEELYTYCNRPKRSILEILQDFIKTRGEIKFDYLFDIIPILQPRAYSIASSQMVDPNKLEILVAVVRYKTRLLKPRMGLCSNFLAGLTSFKDHVEIWTEKSSITFANLTDSVQATKIKSNLFEITRKDKNDLNYINVNNNNHNNNNNIINNINESNNCIDIIMVGPGTGCAPFRAYLQESEFLSRKGSVLFFGCRNKSKDFFFEAEWKRQEENDLLKLFIAFSRDQEEKIYVQDVLRKQGDLVWKLIHQRNAYFFIAGNSKNMPDSIKEELLNIFMLKGKMNREDAISYLDKLNRTKRFQEETWS